MIAVEEKQIRRLSMRLFLIKSLGLFFVLVLVAFLPHIQYLWIGFMLCLLGHFLNTAVMLSNGDKMPVRVSEIEDSELHVPLTAQTKLPLLADIIPWPTGFCSIGDLLFILGVLVALVLIGKFLLVLLVTRVR